MFFFFKKKKIVVDAFTKISGIHDLFPITESLKHIPQWWKDIPSTYIDTDENGLSMERSTIKKCDGLLDCYKTGFIIPLWTDVAIKTNSMGQWMAKMPSNESDTFAMSHNENELSRPLKDYINIKLFSPWLLTEKTGCNFYFSSALWNHLEFLEKFHIPPAVVNFKYQTSTNINTLFLKKDQDLTIYAGTPMIHIIPLTDSNVEIKCHTITREEYENLYLKTYNSSFTGKYRKNKKIRKQNKCPIGF